MRRLYYVLPNVNHTKLAINDLLLQRVDIHHLNVIAKEGTHLGDLPEAPLSIKSDLHHSLVLGGLIGSLLGIGAGLAFHYELGAPLSGWMILTTLFGGAFGAWAASMIGIVVPNRELARFESDIDKGKLLMIVDIPMTRIEEITDMLAEQHPEARLVD